MTVKFDRSRKTWFFVFDLLPGPDGKRRQMKRRGFATETIAQREEVAARQ